MGTSASISFVDLNGNSITTRVNWDGYPQHTGEILKRYFNTPESIRNLINGGEIRSIGETPEYYPEDDSAPVIKLKAGEPVLFHEDYAYIFFEIENKWKYTPYYHRNIPINSWPELT